MSNYITFINNILSLQEDAYTKLTDVTLSTNFRMIFLAQWQNFVKFFGNDNYFKLNTNKFKYNGNEYDFDEYEIIRTDTISTSSPYFRQCKRATSVEGFHPHSHIIRR
jgi:hypothetical protein